MISTQRPAPNGKAVRCQYSRRLESERRGGTYFLCDRGLDDCCCLWFSFGYHTGTRK